ncbi:MAG: DUF4287 domain-containing protein [Bacteroidota bacterium]
MADLQQAILNQIKNLETQTGKSFDEWKQIASKSGFTKHGEMVSFLKTSHGLGHGYANLIVHHANQSSASAATEETDLVAEQYKGKENLKPWYDRLMKEILAMGNDIELAPKKTYMSLRRKKQFAIIQPSTKDRLDVGLNIKDFEPTGNFIAAGSWNGMCTHRIKIEDEKMMDAELIAAIKQAYDQAG